jgi:hypothetical protein
VKMVNALILVRKKIVNIAQEMFVNQFVKNVKLAKTVNV